MNNYGPYFKIAELISKYLQAELDEDEKNELQEWLLSDPHNRELFDELLDNSRLNQRLGIYPVSDKEEAWKNIAKKTKQGKKIKKQKPRYYVHLAAAAFLLFAIGIKFAGRFNKHEAGKLPAKHSSDLMPGGNKAVLTLSDGTKIVLDDTRRGKIAREQNVSIDNVKSGEIVYNVDELFRKADKPVVVNALAFNIIATPRGGDYEVVLPDGTKVWLNAASSLKFPVVFSGSERKVELTGEAYFEVAKNAARPFVVKTNDQTVEVLGTHFNINSYTDENAVKTTLLEGAVKVTGGPAMQTLKLSPGQQSVITDGRMALIANADIGEALAWKNGKFLFHDTDLRPIMRQLSRWYDVDVEYLGPVTVRHYRGRISRNVPVSQVFEILKTSGLNFIIDGRKVIVKS